MPPKGRHRAPKGIRPLLLVLLSLVAVGETVDVTLQAETSEASGAETTSGISVAWLVGGAWTADAVLCRSADIGATVSLETTLRVWPTRLRLRSLNVSSSDMWGVRKIALLHPSLVEPVVVLASCGDACERTPVNSAHWVAGGGAEGQEYAVPPLVIPEWSAGAWGSCCCPFGDPYSPECRPGERTRPVSCSAGEGLCLRVLPWPATTEGCDDYSGCPYEPMCPLGRTRTLSCTGQAWVICSVILCIVIIIGLSCRFCQLRWFLCHPRCKSWLAPEVKARGAIAAGGGNHPDSATWAGSGSSGLSPAAAEARWSVQGSPGLHEVAVSMCGNSRLARMPEDFEGEREMRLETARLLGTWFYDRTSRYCISRTAMGPLRFDERISSGQWVFGVLEQHGEWLQGTLRGRDGGQEHGNVRLRYNREKDIVTSNFQAPGEAFWGEDLIACKVDPATIGCGLLKTSVATTASWEGENHWRPKSPLSIGGTTSTKLSGDWDRPTATDTGIIKSHELLAPSVLGPFGSCGGCTPSAVADEAAWSATGLVQALTVQLGLGPVLENASAPALATGTSVASSASAHSDIPPVLYVTSPDQIISCGGEYELVPDQTPQGYPLWRKRDGMRWLYSGLDNKWYIGGQASADRHFRCASGFVFRDKQHYGIMPDRIGGLWERGDGSVWHKDPSILVTAAPVVAGVDNETLAAALEVADEWMSAQDDVPGIYTITHDNTAVSAGVAAAPPVLARLPLGARVVVKEVVHRPEECRVRGRLESPAGWISIRDMKDGYRWAKKEKQPSPVAGPTFPTLDLSRDYEFPRTPPSSSPLNTELTALTTAEAAPEDGAAPAGDEHLRA